MYKEELNKLMEVIELSDLTYEQKLSIYRIIDSVTELIRNSDSPYREDHKQAVEDALSDFISDCEEADEIKKKKYDE